MNYQVVRFLNAKVKTSLPERCANAIWVPSADLAMAKACRLSIGTISGYQTAPASNQKKQIGGTVAAKLALSAAQGHSGLGEVQRFGHAGEVSEVSEFHAFSAMP